MERDPRDGPPKHALPDPPRMPARPRPAGVPGPPSQPPASGASADLRAAPAPAGAASGSPSAPAAPGQGAQARVQGPPARQAEAQRPRLPPLEVGPDGKAGIHHLVTYLVEVQASDLHAKPGCPPIVRVSGLLEPLDYRILDERDCEELATAMMGDRQRAELRERGEVDFAYSVSGVGRFRVNVHRQRGSLGIAARRILPHAPDFSSLGLPPVVEQLANEHRGLLLVTGPTSSGKTTTCGAIIKHINETRRCHIVTIEDPIEILHEDKLAVVTQREIGQDTRNFYAALRAAMRQDPDVIFVGEIRDTETVGAALQAAETGHLVLATLHTTNVTETVNRIIDFFPADQQQQVRVALAGSLAGVITQRLLPRVGGGRAPAIEVLVMNGRIRDCILEPEKTHEIHDIVAESGFYGMQTFDQALIKLYVEGTVTLDDAKAAANSPHDFQLALQREGALAI